MIVHNDVLCIFLSTAARYGRPRRPVVGMIFICFKGGQYKMDTLTQMDLNILPIKYNFFSDRAIFHKIVYNNVRIQLSNYVSKIEPQDVKSVARKTKLFQKLLIKFN